MCAVGSVSRWPWVSLRYPGKVAFAIVHAEDLWGAPARYVIGPWRASRVALHWNLYKVFCRPAESELVVF